MTKFLGLTMAMLSAVICPLAGNAATTTISTLPVHAAPNVTTEQTALVYDGNVVTIIESPAKTTIVGKNIVVTSTDGRATLFASTAKIVPGAARVTSAALSSGSSAARIAPSTGTTCTEAFSWTGHAFNFTNLEPPTVNQTPYYQLALNNPKVGNPEAAYLLANQYGPNGGIEWQYSGTIGLYNGEIEYVRLQPRYGVPNSTRFLMEVSPMGYQGVSTGNSNVSCH